MIRKVLFVAHWDWVLFHFRLPVARALMEKGVDVVFVCPPGEFTDRLAEVNVPWVPWSVNRKGLQPRKEVFSILALQRIYEGEKPDLVQHFTVKPNLYGSIAARRAGIRCIVNGFTGLGFLFGEGWIPRVGRIAVLPLMRKVFLENNVWTIVQNVDDMQRLLKLRLAHPRRIRLIPGSGVDTQLFHPAPEAVGDGPVRILLAARLLLDKGIPELVEAARLLREAGVAAEVEVAGEPDPGNPRSVSPEQLHTWKMESPVRFHGRVEDMARLLREVDIAAFPSSYPEGLSRFLLEAAATGLPMVASDIAGCRPIARPGENGFLVRPRDAAGLARRLKDLVEDPELRRQFGRRSREIAVEEFDLPSTVERYLRLYKRIDAEARI